MSSEVCPFCGKTYKRLKSHLPHCKAAPSSKISPTKHDARVIQTTSSSPLATASIKPETKTEKPIEALPVTASPQSKKSKQVSLLTSPTPLPSVDTSYSSQSLSLNTEMLPRSSKKKKQKLSGQIKAETMPASATISLTCTQSPSSSSNNKPRTNNLCELKEAAKSKEVKRSLEEITSFKGKDPLNSRLVPQKESKTNPDQNFLRDKAHHAPLSADTKPKGASKTKKLKMKEVKQDLLTAKGTSSSLESKTNKQVGHKLLEGSEEEFENLSVNNMFVNSGGQLARITLQDVKTTLGRVNSTHHSRILSQIGSTDELNSEAGPGSSLGPIPTKTLSDQLQSTSSQTTELTSFKRKSSTSRQTFVAPLGHDVSPHSEISSPISPIRSGILSSQVSQAKLPPHTDSMNDVPKIGHRMTGLPTISPSRQQLFPLVSQTLPARPEMLRADDSFRMEKSELRVRKQNTADNGTKGALTQQTLGQVRLNELPEWLAYKTPRHPGDVVKMMQRGWQWYYQKYIDVKKGRVGGLSMLIAGYCVLSYIWSYPHIKLERWRRHH